MFNNEIYDSKNSVDNIFNSKDRSNADISENVDKKMNYNKLVDSISAELDDKTIFDKSIIQIEKAVNVAKNNELIVIPTDTVYGIGIKPDLKENIQKILSAKGRTIQKPPPVLVASYSQLCDIAVVSDLEKKLVEKFWPGPLTLVLKMRPEINWCLGGKNRTIAVRMPDESLTLSILDRTGPLAVTSANLTGMPPALLVDDAKSYFGDLVAAYVDGGRAKIGSSSTIVDLTCEHGKILRQGSVTRKMLLDFLPNLPE